MAGTREIDGYRISGTLGSGGMAEVYEAESIRFGTRYALKLFKAENGSQDLRERFLAEARLLAKLDHPRIVRVHAYGVEAAGGRPYFVMDLVKDASGCPRTLADAFEAGVDEEQVATWYDDIREGLACIHARGVVHRDLKLQNILVGADGHAVISDFGVAKIFDAEMREDVTSVEDTLVAAARTGRTPVMGTVGYLPPEAMLGTEPSPATDYYALGVIVYHLLTGCWCDTRTDVRRELEGYDPVWADILSKLLCLNPAGRECPDRRALAEERREERELETERQLEAAARRTRWARVAACACALAAAGQFAWQLNRPEPLLGTEDVVAVPEDAPEESDERGTFTRSDYESAIEGVRESLRPVIEKHRRGEISDEGAARELERIRAEEAVEGSVEEALLRRAAQVFRRRSGK